MGEWMLLVHAAATLYMVGVIWFVQIVHYPSFSRVGSTDFAAYERDHVRRTGWIVTAPMLVELGTAIGLALMLGSALAWSGLALLGVVWASTWLLQAPAHARLTRGFDAATHRRLVRTNWARTVGWSVRGVIALLLLAARL